MNQQVCKLQVHKLVSVEFASSNFKSFFPITKNILFAILTFAIIEKITYEGFHEL
jgi:hypothetical protein